MSEMPVTAMFRLLPALLAVWLVSCSSSHVPPLAAAGSAASGDEARSLHERSAAIEAELDRAGLVVTDPDLQRYLETVGSAVVPPTVAAAAPFRVAILRDPVPNAWSLPNGAALVTVGLLAGLDDEAQLAFVLAHEIAHVARQDALAGIRDRASGKLAAQLAGFVVAPLGLADPTTSTLYSLSAAGYGRDREEAADQEALKMVARAGYPTDSVPAVFTRLNAIAGPEAQSRPSGLYSDHPTNAARERRVRALTSAASAPATRPAAPEAYRRSIERAALESVRLRLEYGHLRTVVTEATSARDRGVLDPRLDLYVGDAHRRLGSPPDLSTAAEAYGRALAADPGLHEAHRGLGLVALAREDRETARRELDRYLQSSPTAPDRRFVESLLRKASE